MEVQTFVNDIGKISLQYQKFKRMYKKTFNHNEAKNKIEGFLRHTMHDFVMRFGTSYK